MNHNANDEKWMRLALELAERGRGTVEPNPMVGCVIVNRGELVGEGCHRKFGGPHAEVWACQAAGERARGATAYVTLEPCSTHGKTPPCADLLLSAGVARVVIGAADPTQQGADKLRAAGVEVISGVLQSACRDLLRPFFKLALRQRSYVIAKWAMSLDGRIAAPDGESRWITGQPARALVHRWRGEIDAVAVGVGTALRDDPLLLPRLVKTRNPLRIIFDTEARTPPRSALVRSAAESPVLIAVCEDAPAERASALEQSGCEVLRCPRRGGGVDLDFVVSRLGQRRLTNLMIEGGARLLSAAIGQRIADEIRAFVAPMLIGAGISPLDHFQPGGLAAAPRLQHVETQTIGEDVLVRGYLNDPADSPPPRS